MTIRPGTIQHPVPTKTITIKKNADFRLSLCIIERDEAGTATVLDTADWTVALQVRAEPDEDSPVLMEASTTNGRIAVGIQGTTGNEVNIEIKVLASVTKLIEYEGRAGYDLRVTNSGGYVDYLLQGPAVIEPAYTW